MPAQTTIYRYGFGFLTFQNKCAKATVINFHRKQHPPLLMASASVIGAHPGTPILSRLRACGPVIPEYLGLAGVYPARYASGRYGDRVHYGDRILFLFWAGSCTSHSKRWRALSCLYSLLLGCWPFGLPIMLTLKTRVRHRSRFYQNSAIPIQYGTERNKVVYFLRISKVPGVGLGKNYTGRQVATTSDGN